MKDLTTHPLNPANIKNASRKDNERWQFYQRNLQKHLAAEPRAPTRAINRIREWMRTRRTKT
jgi:hypothetical protein